MASMPDSNHGEGRRARDRSSSSLEPTCRAAYTRRNSGGKSSNRPASAACARRTIFLRTGKYGMTEQSGAAEAQILMMPMGR